MLAGNDERVFLPAWRGGRIIFFTNIITQASTRIGYFAAAASAPGSVKLKRTGKAPITAAQLADCQKMADDGINLQKFFAAMGAGNLDNFIDAMQTKELPYPKDTNPLIYTCLYLDFLRKYAVDSEIIRLYENSAVSARFNPDRSVGIYKTLTARLQSDIAERLLDADLKNQKRLKGPAMSIANLLRECAVVKYDLDKYDAAQDYMLRSVKLHDTEDKWRRLGDFALASQNRPQAIEYYLKAHDAKPLNAPSALLLGRCLVEEGEFEKARGFVEQVANVFVKPAATLMAKIDAAD